MTGYVITLPQIATLKRHEVLKKLSTVDSAQKTAMLHNASGIKVEFCVSWIMLWVVKLVTTKYIMQHVVICT